MVKKGWTTPVLFKKDTMSPDDFQNLNEILIIQAGELEIVIQGQTEEIRDLKAERALLQARVHFLEEQLDAQELAKERIRALEVQNLHLKAEVERMQAEKAAMRKLIPFQRKWD